MNNSLLKEQARFVLQLTFRRNVCTFWLKRIMNVCIAVFNGELLVFFKIIHHHFVLVYIFTVPVYAFFDTAIF